MIRTLCVVACLAACGCAHHQKTQSAYLPPLAAPVYPQPQTATQPVMYSGQPIVAPGAAVMPAPAYAPAAGVPMAPPAAAIAPSDGFIPALADGSCPPCEGTSAVPVAYEGTMQTPACPP